MRVVYLFFLLLAIEVQPLYTNEINLLFVAAMFFNNATDHIYYTLLIKIVKDKKKKKKHIHQKKKTTLKTFLFLGKYKI